MKGAKCFRCTDFPPCDKAFSQKDNFAAHQRLHEASPDALVECHMAGCVSKFSSLKHLARHLKEVHCEGKLACPFCPSRFRTKADLRQHTAEIHDYHELKCTHEACRCGRIFRTPSKLQEHLMSRTRPLSTAPPARPATVRRVPTVSGVFVCMEPGCGKEYTEKKNLLVHRRTIHTGQNVFACNEPACGVAFGYKHVLHRHLQRVHGVAPAEEDVDKEKDDDEETNQESKRKKLRYSSGEMLVATPLDLSIVILCRPCNDVTNPDAMQ